MIAVSRIQIPICPFEIGKEEPEPPEPLAASVIRRADGGGRTSSCFVLQLTSASIILIRFVMTGRGHGLRNEILLLTGNAVIKWPAMHHREARLQNYHVPVGQGVFHSSVVACHGLFSITRFPAKMLTKKLTRKIS